MNPQTLEVPGDLMPGASSIELLQCGRRDLGPALGFEPDGELAEPWKHRHWQSQYATQVRVVGTSLGCENQVY